MARWRHNTKEWKAMPEEERQKIARSEQNKNYHEKYKEKDNARARRNNKRYRDLCIEHYGGKCACCGESTYEFLAIDHVNNDGAEDRKRLGGSIKIYKHIVDHDYPPEYQILCHNCNCAKGFYGYCPHNKLKGETEG